MKPELFLTEPTTLILSRVLGRTNPLEEGISGIELEVHEASSGSRVSNIKRIEFDEINTDTTVSGTAHCFVKDEAGNWKTDSLGNLKTQAVGVYIVFPELTTTEPA
jgi:hypothetical protein